MQHLDMDNVCLPPFDVTRLLDTTAILRDRAVTPAHPTPAAATYPPETTPKDPPEPQNTTGTVGYSDRQTLTIQVTGNDDQSSSVYFDIEQWETRGLRVEVHEQGNRR